MLTKICTRCGTRYTGLRCPKCEAVRQKQYDKHKRDKTSRSFYHTSQWEWLSGQCKMQCGGLDLFQFYDKSKTVSGKLAHHIVPLTDAPGRQWDLSNLIWLSPLSHWIVHKEYKRSPDRKLRMEKKLFEYLRRFKSHDYRQGGEVEKV